LATGPTTGQEILAFSQELCTAGEAVAVTGWALMESSDQVTEQARAISTSTAAMRDEVQSVSASAEQLTASVRELATGSGAVAKAAATAAERARVIDAAVQRLHGASDSVGAVVKTIARIARQTNLLALNATIEAARAGAAGLGFGVVAGEVKALAQQTAQATEAATRSIADVRQGAAAAADGITEIAALIAEIDQLQTLVSSAVEEQAATSAQMSGAISSSARDLEEIAASMDGLTQAARTSSGGAQALSDLAQQVGKPAKQVGQLALRLGATVEAVPELGLSVEFFDRCFKAHVAWRTRLLIAINGGDLPDRVRSSDPTACELGKWIGQASSQATAHPLFRALVESHRTFHAQVGESRSDRGEEAGGGTAFAALRPARPDLPRDHDAPAPPATCRSGRWLSPSRSTRGSRTSSRRSRRGSASLPVPPCWSR
jgi:hypothetical protein